MAKTILITGGAGYIGSHANLYLLEKGYNTIIFDNLIYGHREVVPLESQFINGDLTQISDLETVFSNYSIDAVIHFAAYAYVGESVADPSKYYKNNVIGTFNLLETMRKYNVTNIVFSSTCATYGLPTSIPITENEIQKPINPYGYTKLVIENMLKDFAKAYSLNSVSLRYFNASGADKLLRTGESHDPETHLIPLVLEVASGKREKISIFGNDYNTADGTCIRDYIHVTDLAIAHLKALEYILNSDETTCEFINLGTGNGYSVKQIIDMVEKVTGIQIPFEIKERREGDPDQLISATGKAKRILDFECTHSDLENIIKTAWDWEQKRAQL
jgi:UDP-glucose 4-epimerase